MIWFRHCDTRWPFLWQSANQPPGRWHGDGEGPVQHLSDTPDGAWAEFLRHEEISEAADLAGIERDLWAIDVPDGSAASLARRSTPGCSSAVWRATRTARTAPVACAATGPRPSRRPAPPCCRAGREGSQCGRALSPRRRPEKEGSSRSSARGRPPRLAVRRERQTARTPVAMGARVVAFAAGGSANGALKPVTTVW